MKEALINELRLALQRSADAGVRDTSSRFFKPGEEAMVYGVKHTDLSKLMNDFCKRVKGFPKPEVFDICETLWQSHYLEEAVIACKCAELMSAQNKPEDFRVFERWVNQYVTNWADCDTLCNHTIGTFVTMYPECVQELKQWAKSTHRWTKRASAVTLIIPARRGLFLNDILEIADTLLLDTDDLVQKGYGWMLKAASESHPEQIYEYLLSKKEVMPRTAFRYALEKMPKEWRAEAMKKGKG
jgi:3-methyladenine DNA glycosylase AlkD